MTVCLFSLMLGIITEMGVVTMQMCDASKGGYQEPDSDGIVRFKAHGPINRETRHGVTELRLRDTNNPLLSLHLSSTASSFVKIGHWIQILGRQRIAISLRLGYP